MLRRGILEDSRRAHALDVIERNAEVQARLIEDLLDVSRIMVGQLRLHVERVDFESAAMSARDRPRDEEPKAESAPAIRVMAP